MKTIRKAAGGMARLRTALARVLTAGLAGLAAGAAAVCLDMSLQWFTVDGILLWRADLMGVYLLSGLMAGLVVAAAARLASRRPGFFDVAAAAFLLPYLVPTWDRLDAILGHALVAACLTLVAVGGWLIALRAVSMNWTAATLLAALTVALLLAVNRNLVARPLSPAALGADLGVVLVVLALAATTRRRGTRKVAVATALLLLSGCAAAWVARNVQFATTSAPPPASATSSRRPHVILLTVDTLRHDAFEAVRATPEGVRFRQAFSGAASFSEALATSPWTAPSVASLMTGQLPDEHGYGVRTGDRDRPLRSLAPSIPTLAEGLRAAGYRTEAYVANPLLFEGSGIDRGFEVYRALKDPARSLPWTRLLFARGGIRRATRGWIRGLPYLPAEDVVDTFRHRLAVLRHLQSDDTHRRPYFFWIHLMDPHKPYVRHPDLSPAGPGSLPDQEARYRGEVRYTLGQVTQIVELLQDHGLWDGELVIFTADHGEMFPRDGHEERRDGTGEGGNLRRAGHGHSLHAEVVNVPLLVRPPASVGANRRPRIPAQLIDLPLTIESYVGVDLGLEPSDAARNLAPFLTHPPRGRQSRQLTLAGTEWGPPQRGLYTGAWKLIHFPGNELPDRLYAVDRERTERQNLASRRPEIVEELRRTLDEAWKQMKTAPDANATELDDETRKRLEALGYL